MAGVSNPDVPTSSLGERDHTQNPRQDEHSDIFRYTIEELRSITNQYTTSNEVAALHPAQGSREATPRSSKELMSGVAVYSTKVGAKGGKKRHKQYPLGATTTADRDDGSYGKAGGSSARRITTATHDDKCQARPPMDHFRRLLEEAYPNHVYPVRRRHDEEFHDLRVLYLRYGTRRRSGREQHDALPYGGHNHDSLWWTPPGREVSHV
jgi:hypothetical protein